LRPPNREPVKGLTLSCLVTTVHEATIVAAAAAEHLVASNAVGRPERVITATPIQHVGTIASVHQVVLSVAVGRAGCTPTQEVVTELSCL
jgi:hypothetical protein